MRDKERSLELLAPAKNADFGIEAIIHGADAVYIGGPVFGARAKAGNAVSDIARLVAHAHRYRARVLVALNTLLRDDELEEARRLSWQIHDAGADALIIQDMGLLELDLPPIQLHASTQTNIRTVEKACFLEAVGFSQLVLARELALDQIRRIADATRGVLEFFVHGALCVSYSGQCNISYAHTGRSANRGDCSQACRLPYSLADQQGRLIAADKHLLSMKDNDQSDNLRALVDTGIDSFKIEGRLKDLAYVKNITAHYRGMLDKIIAERPATRRSSVGESTFLFSPRPEKTFNRGATDYFVNGRQENIAAVESPKFVGDEIGTLAKCGGKSFEVTTSENLHNGDGVAWFDEREQLHGLQINRVEKLPNGYRLFPPPGDGKLPTGLRVGAPIFRNRDQAFERQLAGKSAERRIAVRLRLFETTTGFALEVDDGQGVAITAMLSHPHEAARNAEQARAMLRENIGRLGNTVYTAECIDLDLSGAWFVPAAALNRLRREAITALDEARLEAYRQPPRRQATEPPAVYPEHALDYLSGVLNRRAREFYGRHGVSVVEPAYECGQEKGEVSLMVTKHCLRFSFTLCPKQIKGIRPDPLLLINGTEKLTLRFDCKACEMHVVGKLRKNRSLRLREK
ncbi:MAG TPA: U32 family peptidase [Accumulibacter sp.]|jgi:putative protease|nr:U32 family peptidase [Accumulibacter sp.]